MASKGKGKGIAVAIPTAEASPQPPRQLVLGSPQGAYADYIDYQGYVPVVPGAGSSSASASTATPRNSSAAVLEIEEIHGQLQGSLAGPADLGL